MPEKTEYLNYDNAEGHCDVTLSRALELKSGISVETLRVREPTVDDQIRFQERTGSEAQKEVGTFADLCEVSTDDIRSLRLKDYQRLQEAYAGFLD